MLSANYKPKRTAAASRGFIATARLSCCYLSYEPVQDRRTDKRVKRPIGGPHNKYMSVSSQIERAFAEFDGDLSFPGITQTTTCSVGAYRQKYFTAVMLVVLFTRHTHSLNINQNCRHTTYCRLFRKLRIGLGKYDTYVL